MVLSLGHNKKRKKEIIMAEEKRELTEEELEFSLKADRANAFMKKLDIPFITLTFSEHTHNLSVKATEKHFAIAIDSLLEEVIKNLDPQEDIMKILLFMGMLKGNMDKLDALLPTLGESDED